MKAVVLILFLSALAACQGPAVTRKETPAASASTYTDSLNQNLFNVQAITFGRFCGMCQKDCATMFVFTIGGNANSLCFDKSNNYFQSQVKCGAFVTSKEALDLAGDVYRHLPRALLTYPKNEESFGCPDCSDGCGYYLEIRTHDVVKKFRLDAQTSKMEGDAKAFTDYLIPVFDRMVALHTGGQASNLNN